MSHLTYDPTSDLKHWPTPMARFGLNPYSQPMYRIVFAPSRRNLASADGVNFQWIQTYDLGNVWLMERWRPPGEFAGTKEKWDETLAETLGPYPDRGEYEHCFTFDVCTPDHANLEKIVMWLEEGKRRPYAEHQQACRDQYEHEEQEKRNRMDAIIRDKWSAFGSNAFVSSGAKRGTKTTPIVRTANELGLPIGHNKFVNYPRRKAAKHGNTVNA